jgi:hypothetical protein
VKKIFSTLLIILAQTAAAQKDSIGNKFNSVVDSTGFGQPEGNRITKEIGTDGGTVTSEDGNVELHFPKGALESTTVISIQTISNLAPNALGKAYQFGPDGTSFKIPVEIRVRYTKEEEEFCPPDLMSIAMQDRTGKWTFIDFEEYDSTTRTLSGLIEHFSTFSRIADITINPKETRLKIKKEIELLLSDVRHTAALLHSNQNLAAYVNGVPNGDDRNGTVRTYTEQVKSYTIILAVYTAPAALPELNPVTATFDLAVVKVNKKKGVTRTIQKTIKCKITVYDEFKIEVTALWDNTSLGMGTSIWTDTSSFKFQLETISSSRTALVIRHRPGDIYNSPLTLKVLNPAPGCTYTYVNKDVCKGFAHISEVQDINLIGRDAEYLRVAMNFKFVRMELPIVRIACRGTFSPGIVPSIGLPAVPSTLLFTLKEGEQEIFSDQSLGVRAKMSVARVVD